jgi:sulfite reductase (NADPH) flavoprotein alpha-component
MNSPLRPPLATLVPENAPFSAEQRVWLNGFFAGLLEGDATALSPQDAAALLPGVEVGGKGEDDDDAPWHDQTMPLALRPMRLQLRGLRRRAARQEGSAAESLRAWRQGHRPDAEGALRRD